MNIINKALGLLFRCLILTIMCQGFVFAETTGTGFFVTDDGYLVTNRHVIDGAGLIKFRDSMGRLYEAELVRVDVANDLALLKSKYKVKTPLPIGDSSAIKKGEHVFTIGFPLVQLQGMEGKLTDGLISSFSGIQGEPNTFQISVPLQPGNSGGPLINEDGLVMGVVVSKLSMLATIKSGVVPENVNYAIKSNYLWEFLRTEPAVSKKLSRATLGKSQISGVVQKVENSIVLIYAGSAAMGVQENKSVSGSVPQDKNKATKPRAGYGYAEQSCQFKSDCQFGSSCILGQCLKSNLLIGEQCRYAAQCDGKSTQCINSVCANPPRNKKEGEACQIGNDCEDGLICGRYNVCTIRQ